MVHMGMHGTVEWLPGSPLGNTALSWSDQLLGGAGRRVLATSSMCARHVIDVCSPRHQRVLATSSTCARHGINVCSPRHQRVLTTSSTALRTLVY